MSMNSVGRPTRAEGDAVAGFASLTGARGLLQDEALIFERNGWGKTGVDLETPSRSCSARLVSAAAALSATVSASSRASSARKLCDWSSSSALQPTR